MNLINNLECFLIQDQVNSGFLVMIVLLMFAFLIEGTKKLNLMSLQKNN